MARGMPSDEFDLIEQAQTGDTSAMNVLLDRHYDKAVRKAKYLSLSDDSRIYDVVQNAMLRVWRKIGLCNPALGKFQGWFMTIVRYESIKLAEKEKWRTSIVKIENENHWLEPQNVFSHYDGGYSYNLLIYDILSELLKMNEPQRTIMAMFLDGYSYRDIMNATGATWHSVNSYIKRAKKKLQKELE